MAFRVFKAPSLRELSAELTEGVVAPSLRDIFVGTGVLDRPQKTHNLVCKGGEVARLREGVSVMISKANRRNRLKKFKFLRRKEKHYWFFNPLLSLVLSGNILLPWWNRR